MKSFLVVYCLPGLTLCLIELYGMWHTPNILIGMYANHDGMWVGWNLAGILEWGRIFDLSPFNPLSGMGSMFLPNLPWLNPAAASLALPLSRDLTYLVSYSIYYAEIFISITVLLRVLGLSPLRSSLAAQLHVIMLFPPTSATFGSLSWYSLAVYNAHLMAIVNLALAMFLLLGQRRGVWKNTALAAGIIVLVVIGLFSAPIHFVTYWPVYGLIAVAFLLWQRRDQRRTVWRVGSIFVLVAILWVTGFIDYLRATAAMSARAAGIPPAFAAGWALLTPAYWLDIWHRFNPCVPEGQPLCGQGTIFKVHIAAICGALIQVWRHPPTLRMLAVLFLILIVSLEAYAFTSYAYLFGEAHVVSVPYITWTAYTFFAMFAVICVFALFDVCAYVYRKASSWYARHDPQLVPEPGRRPSLRWTPILRWVVVVVVTLVIPLWAYYLGRVINTYPYGRVLYPYVLWSAYAIFTILVVVLVLTPGDLIEYVRKISSRNRRRNTQPTPVNDTLLGAPFLRWTVIIAASLVIPLWAYYLWETGGAPYQPPPPAYKKPVGILGRSSQREPVVGTITNYLIEHARIKPGHPFRGYAATYFGDPRGHVRKGIKFAGNGMAWNIYADARFYFDEHYGNRFQEMDLWEFDIPTLEDYGQWVNKPVFTFINGLFSEPGDVLSPLFLRIYKLDFDWLAALGVRFLITDLSINDDRATLRSRQDSKTAGTIYLYELSHPNTATYSPTQTVKVNTFLEAIDAFRINGRNLEDKAIVFENLAGQFQKANKIEMRAERDGFRIVADSKGASLIVLPVQFSRCFVVEPVGTASNSASARLIRANGIQTGIYFEKQIDVLMRFEFGLIGSASCRMEDVRDLARLGIK